MPITRASLTARGNALIVCVEPWAHEFEVPLDGRIEILVDADRVSQGLDVEIDCGRATVWINDGTVSSAKVNGQEVWP